VWTVAGNGTATPTHTPVDGYGTSALFNGPRGITLATDGTMYVADTSGRVIRKIATGTC
jgi:sugar lactone lactonase YvrE